MTSEEFTLALLDELDHSVCAGSKIASLVKKWIPDPPDIFYNPHENGIATTKPLSDSVRMKLSEIGTKYHPDAKSLSDGFWCGVRLCREKAASFKEQLMGVSGWNDKLYSPSPLAALLATGVLGAGLGYGGATLASGLLPGKWDKSKFKRSGLLLGGAIGASPGALETFKSLLVNQPLLDGSHMRAKTGHYDGNRLPLSSRYSTGPLIDGDAMMHTVWRSPVVSNQLSPKEKSLFTGVMASTQQIAGSPYVTPVDLARLTAGMGIGYASGLVAGKVLGALTGLPASAQQALANTGMYAGAVKSVLPMIFGIR